MILSLARIEFRMLRRTRQAWWPVLALGALVLLSFASVAVETASAEAAKRAVASAERARWLNQGEKDPHSAAHYSIYAFKPVPPLVGLDPGATPFLGQAVWLEAHNQNDLLHRPQQGASALQRAGLANPSALLLSFGPLVVFLLAFVAVAQDRERGTMRLALGAAIHPRDIVVAKASATLGTAAVVMVLPAAIAALVVAAFGGGLTGDTLLRLGAWSAMMLLYLALFTAVGLAVALRAPNARTALALLFGAWILLALVLPRAASSTAEALRPLPSSQAIKQQMQAEAPAYWSAEETTRLRQRLLARYGVSRLEDIPNLRMAELDMQERHSHAVFDRLLKPFYARVIAQDRLFASFGFLSPTVAAQALSASVVGSDFTHHHDFIANAEAYRRNLVNRMNADGMAARVSGDERHTNDVDLWAQIPEFRYGQPRLGVVNTVALPALGALLLWLGAAALLLRAAARGLRP